VTHSARKAARKSLSMRQKRLHANPFSSMLPARCAAQTFNLVFSTPSNMLSSFFCNTFCFFVATCRFLVARSLMAPHLAGGKVDTSVPLHLLPPKSQPPKNRPPKNRPLENQLLCLRLPLRPRRKPRRQNAVTGPQRWCARTR